MYTLCKRGDGTGLVMMWMDEDCCMKKCQSLIVERSFGRERNREIWNEILKANFKTLTLMKETTEICDILLHPKRLTTTEVIITIIV